MSRGRPGRSNRRPTTSPSSLLRPVVLALLATAIVAGAWAWWRRDPAFTLPAAGDQENVLLVTIDTLRADALSSYGGPALTPNLDTLAAGGARFTFAHAHAVMTLVSHASMLTGRLPYEHGVRDNAGFRVAPGTATAATRLKTAGFATGAFVAGFPLTKRFGLAPGFDVYDDQIPEMLGAAVFAMPERPADVVVDRAGAWIGAQSGRFFAWVHLFDPHTPYRPPPAVASSYATQPYYGEVAFVDQMLGRLFDRLAALSRPTLVIVTSDHGESLGEHGEQTHGMFAYEATLRVPLIVARVMPGQSVSPFRGRVVDTPVQHIDLLPTILDSAGLAADASLPGVSLRAAIDAGHGADRPTYFEALSFNITRGWAPLRGVIANRAKYVDLPIPELYDLNVDAGEARNLAAAEPDRMQSLARTLLGMNTAAPAAPGRESSDVTAALRSLGYLSGRAPARGAYTEADDPKRLAGIDRDLHSAQGLYESGKPREAIAILSRVLEQQPRMADAYTYLAYVHWQMGNPRQAIETLELALTREVPDRDIRVRLGLYLAESGANVPRAIALLEGLPVDDVEALNGLGIAYGHAGRTTEAIDTLGRILAHDPTNGLALQNIASLQLSRALSLPARDRASQGALLAEAEATARSAIAADPALPGAYTTLGVALANQGRRGDAIESWKKAVQLDPGEFPALYNLVVELGKAGRTDEARAFGQQYLATAPPAFFQREIGEIRQLIGGAP